MHQHLPHFAPSLETYFLTCLLHDIGTTQENLHSTRISFEFYGGYLALNILQEFGAPKEQAESVAEAIIRHQDLGDIGAISTVGQLIQLSTVFGASSAFAFSLCFHKATAADDGTDNMGINPTLISKETIESVVGAFPRGHWSSCFAATIREEVGLKPWAHTTAIQGFAEGVENNKLMQPFDG